MIRSIFLLTIIGCILQQSTVAQEVNIQYDFLSSQVRFFQKKNGSWKSVKKVIINEGTQVKVEVGNINPFVWQFQANLIQAKPTNNSIGNGLQSMLSGLKLNPGNLVSGFFGNNPFSNLMNARGNESSTMGRLKEAGSYFYETIDSVKQILREYDQLGLLENLLSNLQLTDKLTENEFKTKLSTYINEYAGWPINELDAAIKVGLFQDARKSSFTDSLQLLHEQIHLLASKTNENAIIFPENGITIRDYLVEIDSNYIRALSNLSTKESFSKIHYRNYQLYYSLQKSSFQQQQLLVSSYTSDQLKLIFKNQQNKDSNEILIALPNHAKVKFFNTNGIVIPMFKDLRYTYFVDQDSTIKTDGINYIVPYLAAQVNVCKQYSENLKWGYNLGLGLPLSNDKSFIVTTGLCLIFGRNDLFSLAGGVAGAKIKTLGRGLKIGDKVRNPLTPLTYKEQIKIAPFLSLSFNLAALK